MQDRPTAIELLRAAQEFCDNDLMPTLTGRVRFHARVLRNVLAILEREWAGEESAIRSEWDRLQTLLGGDDDPAPTVSGLGEQVRAANAELASRIRRGDYDDRFDETLETLRLTVAEKLEIANPKWTAEA